MGEEGEEVLQRFWVRYTEPWPFWCVVSIRDANWVKKPPLLRCSLAILGGSSYYEDRSL